MRVRRVSKSCSLICTGSSSGGVLAQPASASASAARQPIKPHEARGVTGCTPIPRADSHGGELRFRDALQHQRAAHRRRTALAEANVVFAGTAFIGVALELHLEVRMTGQVARM